MYDTSIAYKQSQLKTTQMLTNNYFDENSIYLFNEHYEKESVNVVVSCFFLINLT